MSDTPPPGPGGPAATAPGRGLASLSKGAKWLGGIVVVALVGALVPLLVDGLRPEQPEAKLGAQLDNVAIHKPVSLDEYKIRQEEQFVSFDGGTPRIRLVAAYAQMPAVADAPADPGAARPVPQASQDQDTAKDETRTPDDQTTTPDDQTTTPDDQTTTPDDQTTTPDDTSTERRRSTDDSVSEITVPLMLDKADQRSMKTGVLQALTASQENLILPPACVQNAAGDTCGLQSMQLQMGVDDDFGAAQNISTEQVARQLVKVFQGTRTQPSPDHPGKRELVGVSVEFDVAMTGFRGRTVDVRWTLFGAGGARVPGPWLRNQLALKLKGEATEDRGSGEFWVPIPQARGPFYIQIRVYDDKGSRLARADTPRFR